MICKSHNQVRSQRCRILNRSRPLPRFRGDGRSAGIHRPTSSRLWSSSRAGQTSHLRSGSDRPQEESALTSAEGVEERLVARRQLNWSPELAENGPTVRQPRRRTRPIRPGRERVDRTTLVNRIRHEKPKHRQDDKQDRDGRHRSAGHARPASRQTLGERRRRIGTHPMQRRARVPRQPRRGSEGKGLESRTMNERVSRG